ncbi:MAG: bifunctional metallophosphatase/5'-nucleotidase [Pseudomonadota bacterium]
MTLQVRRWRHHLATLLAACCIFPAQAHAPAGGAPIELHLVAFNDFHGNLEASKFNYLGADNKPASTQAGGVDTLAAALQAWRREDRELLLVAAGDLVGASPALSSMWADEPSIAAMNLLHLDASAVGNHEFDHGRAELLRQQNGGCASLYEDKACKLAPTFEGAKFPYLGANVFDSASGQPLLPAYRIVQAHGVKVGVIGAVLHDVPSVVLASAIVGLRFDDEAQAINKVVPELKAQGVNVFVVLIHEGGHTVERFDARDCSALKGPIVDIVKRLDPAIRLVVTGHSHQGYQCKVDGRVVTQAAMGGQVLSRIRLSLDPKTQAVRDIDVQNVPMLAGQYPPDPAAQAFMARVRERSAQALARPVARLAVRSTTRRGNAAGESALGDLIADAELAAVADQGGQICFMNVGGIRKDLDVGEDLVATYGHAQAVMPFSNTLTIMNMNAAQIRAVLEQQWTDNGEVNSTLQVSHGFRYRFDRTRPAGQRVLDMTLNGVALDEAKPYRIVANNFLAEGRDGFTAFRAATNKMDTSIVDLDALIGHLIRRDRAGKPAGAAQPAERFAPAH